jgi:hypothetical protein
VIIQKKINLFKNGPSDSLAYFRASLKILGF